MIKPIKVCNWSSEGIKKLREQYNLTQKEMADIVGVTQQVIQRAESGEHSMTRMTKIAWNKIAEHLDNTNKLA